MQSRPISDYISFGCTLRYLQDIQGGWLVHKPDHILDNIDLYFHCLSEFSLVVTERAAYELVEFREKIASTDDNYLISEKEADELRGIMLKLRPIIEADSAGLVAFIVTDKRLDVNKLLSNVPALLAPDTFDNLPEIAQYDLKEAGKCIASVRPTAAAFHILRGTEAVLRDIYCVSVKRRRGKLMWGPMVEHLRIRRRKPPAPLLDNLDNIRKSFRNPTQHPEKIYDIDEVQDLFSLCIDVINRMNKYKNSIKQKSG